MGQITLAEHLRLARETRGPLVPAKAREMAAISRVTRALSRLRPVHWPKADPLTGPDVCFVLNITQQSFWQAVTERRLRATKVGRHYEVTQADLRAYLHGLIAEAEELEQPVPEAARAVAGSPAKAPKQRRS